MKFIKGLYNLKTKFQERVAELVGVPISVEKLPIYPGWFFSARLGQPRLINFNEIRTFAKSPWVQMVELTIKKAITRCEWKIILKDEDSDDSIDNYSKDVKQITEFFDNVNINNEDINDIVASSFTDIAEIDAGVWVKVFDQNSYIDGERKVYDMHGHLIEKRKEKVLKPFGSRKLIQLFEADGSTFLKNPDVFKRMQGYYQYSFKHPVASPRWFSNDEICYFMMNRRTDSVYGFSPVESVQQVIDLLIQSTRYNREFFKNNAIPDAILAVKNAGTESLKKIKTEWKKQFQGRAHRFGFLKADAAELIKFSQNLKDMEWLNGQKWYYHLVFGMFGLSPAEAGFYEGVNRASQEGQERISAKNAVKPYLDMFQRRINTNIIPEILQKPDIKVKLKYFYIDKGEEKEKFEQYMKEIDKGTMTVNEFRTLQGRETVEWGDTPSKSPDSQFGQSPFNPFGQNPQPNQNNPPEPTPPKPPEPNKDKDKNKPPEKKLKSSREKYCLKFEKFISEK